MKPLLSLVLFLLFAACQDGTPVQPAMTVAPEMSTTKGLGSQGDLVKMVPLTGMGTWAIGDWGDYDCDSDDGSTRVLYMPAEYRTLSHLGGNATSDVFHCVDLPTFTTLWTHETLTAPNGDKLILFGPSPMDAIPEGYDWGWNNVVLGGTGRFSGAIGEGVVYGTYDPATGGGDAVLDLMISTVGSVK